MGSLAHRAKPGCISIGSIGHEHLRKHCAHLHVLGVGHEWGTRTAATACRVFGLAIENGRIDAAEHVALRCQLTAVRECVEGMSACLRDPGMRGAR